MTRAQLQPSLRATWADWIAGQQWDLFVTLTSEKQTHPEAMLKRFRYCIRKAGDHCYGKNFERRETGPQWLVGLERTKQGWPHSHAVVRFPDFDLATQDGRAIFDLGYWQKWFSDTGGFAWLELPRSQLAVVSYVSKYVVKDGDLEWSSRCDFANPLPQLAVDLRSPVGIGAP